MTILWQHYINLHSSSLLPDLAACWLGSNLCWREHSLAQWCTGSQLIIKKLMINDDQWVLISYHRLTLCSMWMFAGCCSCHTRCWELCQRRMGLHSLRAGHSCTGSTWYCLLIIIMIRIKKIFINDNYSPSLTTKRKQKIVDKNLFMVSYCW